MRKKFSVFLLIFSLMLGLISNSYFYIQVQAQETEKCQYYDWFAHDGEQHMQSKGDVNALVLLIDFPDDLHDESSTPEKMQDLFFGGNSELDSVSKFLEKSSYGKLNFTGDVYGWYTAKNDRESYGLVLLLLSKHYLMNLWKTVDMILTCQNMMQMAMGL